MPANYEEQKKIGLPDNFKPIIFEKRRCALLVDDELSEEQKTEFDRAIKSEVEYQTEILIQEEIKKFVTRLSLKSAESKKLKAKIERKANKRFKDT